MSLCLRGLLFSQEIAFEVGKVGRQLDRAFLALHKALQRVGDGNRFADNLLDRSQELGRVGGFEKDTGFSGLQTFGESTVPARPMRVEQLVVTAVGVGQRLAYLPVGIGRTADVGADGVV